MSARRTDNRAAVRRAMAEARVIDSFRKRVITREQARTGLASLGHDYEEIDQILAAALEPSASDRTREIAA
jgi:hypothetical protein